MHMQLHYIFEEQVPQRSAQLGASVLPFKPHPAAVSVRGAWFLYVHETSRKILTDLSCWAQTQLLSVSWLQP